MEKHQMSDVTDSLVCPTCLDSYDLDKQAPYLMPCGHTFCLACIHSLVFFGGYKCTYNFCQWHWYVTRDMIKSNVLVKVIISRIDAIAKMPQYNPVFPMMPQAPSQHSDRAQSEDHQMQDQFINMLPPDQPAYFSQDWDNDEREEEDNRKRKRREMILQARAQSQKLNKQIWTQLLDEKRQERKERNARSKGFENYFVRQLKDHANNFFTQFRKHNVWRATEVCTEAQYNSHQPQFTEVLPYQPLFPSANVQAQEDAPQQIVPIDKMIAANLRVFTNTGTSHNFKNIVYPYKIRRDWTLSVFDYLGNQTTIWEHPFRCICFVKSNQYLCMNCQPEILRITDKLHKRKVTYAGTLVAASLSHECAICFGAIHSKVTTLSMNHPTVTDAHDLSFYANLDCIGVKSFNNLDGPLYSTILARSPKHLTIKQDTRPTQCNQKTHPCEHARFLINALLVSEDDQIVQGGIAHPSYLYMTMLMRIYDQMVDDTVEKHPRMTQVLENWSEFDKMQITPGYTGPASMIDFAYFQGYLGTCTRATEERPVMLQCVFQEKCSQLIEQRQLAVKACQQTFVSMRTQFQNDMPTKMIFNLKVHTTKKGEEQEKVFVHLLGKVENGNLVLANPATINSYLVGEQQGNIWDTSHSATKPSPFSLRTLVGTQKNLRVSRIEVFVLAIGPKEAAPLASTLNTMFSSVLVRHLHFWRMLARVKLLMECMELIKTDVYNFDALNYSRHLQTIECFFQNKHMLQYEKRKCIKRQIRIAIREEIATMKYMEGISLNRIQEMETLLMEFKEHQLEFLN